MVNDELKTTVLNTVEMKLDAILQVMQEDSFSMTKASRIVGGNARLKRLIASGDINVIKKARKWFCNASDVLRNAQMKQVKPNKTKSK